MANHALIRWMIDRDVREVIDIERRAFPVPWTEDVLLDCLHEQGYIGMVADLATGRNSPVVVGYMIFESLDGKYLLHNLAVHHELRRIGLGMALVDKLKSNLTAHNRQQIAAVVGEDNLDAQLFFKACGFIATRVVHDYWVDSKRAAYQMTFDVRGFRRVFNPHNRICKYLRIGADGDGNERNH